MIRTPVVWLAALWIGGLIHVDWHLGRPGHTHLSLGLPYHWLLAVAAFAPLPWLIRRRWSSSFTQASVIVIALGVILGQGVEPLGEVIRYDIGFEPFTNVLRWRVFAEFMTAGLVAYVIGAGLARTRDDRHDSARP